METEARNAKSLPLTPPERKARKSVAFTEEKLVVDVDGSVSMVSSPIDDNRDTALSHTPRTPPLSAALGAFADASQAPTGDDAALLDAPADDGGLDPTLLKKKKKKTKTEGEEAEGLDLSLKKKKKKKVGEDFAAKLQALDLEGKEGKEDEEGEEDAQAEDEGDMDEGTGIWEHDKTAPSIPFSNLLRRFYKQLELKNPDHAASGTRSYKIPPPQCLREGNKKTIFANIADIAKRMKRSEEHLTQYLFAELGTIGSVDGSRRLVIKGRFQQKQIENVLRKYIIEYLVCKTCRSPDTQLNKGENRLYFIECNSCGSRRSVVAIKTGFRTLVGKRKKQG